MNTEFGRALLWAGHYEEAIDQFRKAIVLDPSRNRPYNLLGRALYLQGKNAEALTECDESIKRGAQLAAGLAAVYPCVLARLGHRDVVLLRNGMASRWRPFVAQTYACLGDASGRSNISKNRLQRTNRIFRRFSSPRNWHGCARTPVSRAAPETEPGSVAPHLKRSLSSRVERTVDRPSRTPA